jgi:dipeptidyl aminopeptidase/acylaminoacyl peptidase
MPLEAGMRLGPYEILAFLGAGGMGEVYRGRDTRLGREVAIKLVTGSLSADPELLRRFEQEARAAGTLNHPNLLVVFDVGSHEGRPYLISELLEGETLRKRLAGGPLAPRKAIDYAVQIARGLAAAHAKGIVHRDLKPENLFITRGGQIKILDFGLAKLTQLPPAGSHEPTLLMMSTPGQVMGTPGYMSPEQVRGQPVDHRSDLFSFGAVLYEMLSGRRAFGGDTMADIMTAVLREDPPERAEAGDQLPPALRRIVRHCLEKDPEARTHSAHDLAFELEGLTAEPAAGAARPAHWSWPGSLHPAWLGLAAGLVAAGILAVALASHAGPAANSAPVFQRITFRRGLLDAARFTPDGKTVVYSAAWEGLPQAVFQQSVGAPDSLALALPSASLLAVSPRTSELAIALGCRKNHTGTCAGTLATAPMSGAAPREMRERVQQADWAPDGQAVALVHDDGSMARLEFPAGKVLYETDGHISFPRVSPRGDRIAFFDHPSRDADDASVAVVDLAGKRRTLAADVGSAQGLAWAPDGQEVWYTAARSRPDRALYGVSLSGKGRSIATVPGSITLQDIAADGRVLLTTDTTRTGIHALPPGEARERELSWLDYSFLGDLSDDGSAILFDEESQSMGPTFVVCLRRTDGSPLVRLGDGLAEALSPDGQWALSMQPEKGTYVLLPTHAGSLRELPSHGLRPVPFRRAAWFPDGRRIAFVAAAPGHAARVWVQELTGTAPKPLTPEGFRFWHVRPISPDGRYLFADSPARGTMIFPVAGGEPRPVPGIAPPQTPIRWSADGRHLFVRNAAIPMRISLLDLETGRQTPWKEIAPPDLAGATPPVAVWLSADGKSYAYSLERRLSDLYLVDGLR